MEVRLTARPQSSAGAIGGVAGSPEGPAGIGVRAPVGVVAGSGGVRATGIAPGGAIAGAIGADEALIGVLPPVYPEWLGDRSFSAAHGCRFPYVIGEMARGIASADMVIAGARAGMMAFFGSAGLAMPEIDVVDLQGPQC